MPSCLAGRVAASQQMQYFDNALLVDRVLLLRRSRKPMIITSWAIRARLI